MSHPVDATLPQLCLTLSSAAFGGGGGGQATHAEQASLDRVGKKGKRERGNKYFTLVEKFMKFVQNLLSVDQKTTYEHKLYLYY